MNIHPKINYMKKLLFVVTAMIVVTCVTCQKKQKKRPNFTKRSIDLIVKDKDGNSYEVVEEIPLDKVPFQKGQSIKIAQPSANVPEYWEIEKPDQYYIKYQEGKIADIQGIYFE